jgi:hypothetical protein
VPGFFFTNPMGAYRLAAGIGPPEELFACRGARLGDDLDLAVLLQHRHCRIGLRHHVDLALLHGGSRWRPPHADDRHVGRLQAALASRS